MMRLDVSVSSRHRFYRRRNGLRSCPSEEDRNGKPPAVGKYGRWKPTFLSKCQLRGAKHDVAFLFERIVAYRSKHMSCSHWLEHRYSDTPLKIVRNLGQSFLRF